MLKVKGTGITTKVFKPAPLKDSKDYIHTFGRTAKSVLESELFLISVVCNELSAIKIIFLRITYCNDSDRKVTFVLFYVFFLQ